MGGGLELGNKAIDFVEALVEMLDRRNHVSNQGHVLVGGFDVDEFECRGGVANEQFTELLKNYRTGTSISV